MPSRLLLAGACVAALVSAGPAGAGSEKPVQDTAMEAMMQAQGFGHSPSRWEAQGMPATMDAHEAVTEKLLNLMPRVGDLYSKMPDFKVPSGPMVPEELDPKKVPIDFTQPPPMGYYDSNGYFTPTRGDTGGISARMVDSHRNALPWQQNMPISLDFPPKMPELPSNLNLEKGSPADNGKKDKSSAFSQPAGSSSSSGSASKRRLI